MDKPKVGMRFYHARVLDESLRDPALYQVTRVGRGMVYYRQVAHRGLVYVLEGNSECVSIENFSKVVKA